MRYDPLSGGWYMKTTEDAVLVADAFDDAPGSGSPLPSSENRWVARVAMLLTNRSVTPFMSPGTRFEACDWKVT